MSPRRQFIDLLLGQQRPISDEHARAVAAAIISGLPATDLETLTRLEVAHHLQWVFDAAHPDLNACDVWLDAEEWDGVFRVVPTGPDTPPNVVFSDQCFGPDGLRRFGQACIIAADWLSDPNETCPLPWQERWQTTPEETA